MQSYRLQVSHHRGKKKKNSVYCLPRNTMRRGDWLAGAYGVRGILRPLRDKKYILERRENKRVEKTDGCCCQACTQDSKPKQGPVKRPRRAGEDQRDPAVLATRVRRGLRTLSVGLGALLCSALRLGCFVSCVLSLGSFGCSLFSFLSYFLYRSSLFFLLSIFSVSFISPFPSHCLVSLYLPRLCLPLEVGYLCRRVCCPRASLLFLWPLLSNDHDLH